ncbi:MAG: molybdopterin-dependent oxidoreductase [Coriobacteriales bacterium]|jgi:anaerobic selenocysteine-containing dehydrogenase|nr:molybdopterin-dependent oxidoreductase [Coriobacteriales bacterium]
MSQQCAAPIQTPAGTEPSAQSPTTIETPLHALSDIYGGLVPVRTDVTADERPITWEEDGYTVIRGHARSAPGCHNACGVLQYVKDGRLVKVEGDPENPYNQGRLCSRCLAMTDVVYHEDRLMHPMKRARADRGLDRFERISWDEAYDIIEAEFKRITEVWGAHTIMMCQGTGRDIHQVTRLNAAIGSPNEGVPYFAGNSCYLPRIASMACMLGDAAVMDCSQFLPLRYDDPRYVVPEFCIVWGHNPFYSNADGFFGHWFTDLMQRGMKVAVIDPQLTWLAARAGENWLRVRPGGDGALAMAMLKIIIEEELYDHEFCEYWVYGLEQVAERCKEYDLEELSARSWVPLEDIRRVARTYATSKPAAIQWGVALDQQTGGQQAAHAVTALWTITGNLDVPGGNVIGRPCWGIAQPNWTGTWGYDELLTSAEEPGLRMGAERFPLFGVGFKNLSSNATFESWEHVEGEDDLYGPYQFKAAYFVTNNFTACMGAQTKMQMERWYREKLEFICWSDLFMNPSMFALADVVLPVSTWAERIGFGGLNPYSISCINQAIEPVGETKADQTIFLELGRRVTREGIVPGTAVADADGKVAPKIPRSNIVRGEALPGVDWEKVEKLEAQYHLSVDVLRGVHYRDIAFPWNTVEEMWDYALQQGGFTWKELQHAVWKMPEFTYRKYETGGLRDDGGLGFATPSGRAEIYSMVFQHVGGGLDPLPAYVEPIESPYSAPELAQDYPLILTTGARVPHFFHSEHRQIARLRALHPDPLVYIHPDTAADYGIEEGEWIWIWNNHGKCFYKTSFNATYDPRVIQTEHAWWFPERGHGSSKEDEAGPYGVFESNCNNLVPLPAGVSGFGSNYKAMVCQIGKDEPAISNVPDTPQVR